MFLPLRLREAFSLGGLSVRELAERTWNKTDDHEIMTRAAAVSFYAMLALVPFLGLILTFIALLLPDLTGRSGNAKGIGNLTTEELRSTLKSAFPTEGYQVVEDQIARLQDQKRPPFLLMVFGLAVTFWLASSLFVAIIDAMNRIHGVNETRSFLKIRIVAIVMTCIQTVLLLGSLLAIVLWPQFLTAMGLSQPAAVLATLVQWVVVFFTVLLSFALAFFVGPDAEQSWEWITPGSLAGTAVFLVASLGFRIYVQSFGNYDKTYGSLGGVMILLFWFWISSMVLLGSAQMNKVIEDASPLGKAYGQKIDATADLDLKSIEPEAASKPPT